MIRGRFFTDEDYGYVAPPVIVVNQAFADKYLRRPGSYRPRHLDER